MNNCIMYLLCDENCLPWLGESRNCGIYSKIQKTSSMAPYEPPMHRLIFEHTLNKTCRFSQEAPTEPIVA
jgi:hypothetical protein